MKQSLLCDSVVDTAFYHIFIYYRYTCRILISNDKYHPVRPQTSICPSLGVFMSSTDLVVSTATISVTSTTQYGSRLRKREFLTRVGDSKALNGRCITAATSEGDNCLRRVLMSREASGSLSDPRTRFSMEAR